MFKKLDLQYFRYIILAGVMISFFNLGLGITMVLGSGILLASEMFNDFTSVIKRANRNAQEQRLRQIALMRKRNQAVQSRRLERVAFMKRIEQENQQEMKQLEIGFVNNHMILIQKKD